jgi:hydroxypyruvate isomerase
MPQLAANLSTLFNDSPFLDRFARAAAAGFRRVEFQFPYAHTPDELAKALEEDGLRCELFNMPPGDWVAGERGLASHPARVAEFRQSVLRSLMYARRLRCPRLHCLSGLRDPGIPLDQQRATLVENLRFAANALAEHGLTLLVEPLNPYDVPSYMLYGSRTALDLIAAVGAPNLLLQYDIYHMQRGEGELAATIAANLDRIGHIQIADTPGRHQPGTGEINYRFLLPHLDRIGYAGIVGLEYFPDGPAEATLSWVVEYGLSLA